MDTRAALSAQRSPTKYPAPNAVVAAKSVTIAISKTTTTGKKSVKQFTILSPMENANPTPVPTVKVAA